MWHVAVPVAPLRAAPDDRAEAVSELLAGARVELLESGERDWVHVRNVTDGYRGWCDRKQLADLAVRDMDSFAKLAEAARAAL